MLPGSSDPREDAREVADFLQMDPDAKVWSIMVGLKWGRVRVERVIDRARKLHAR